MQRLADAERLPGKRYWTIYDGRGGIYHATRYPQAARDAWMATLYATRGRIADNVPRVVTGRTLRDLRAKLAPPV